MSCAACRSIQPGKVGGDPEQAVARGQVPCNRRCCYGAARAKALPSAYAWAIIAGRRLWDTVVGLYPPSRPVWNSVLTTWRPLTLTGWGRTRRAETRVARPERPGQLVEAVDKAGPSVCLYGAGHSYGDDALNSGGATVITTRLDRVLDFDAETGEVEVEPGVSMDSLLRDFGPRGWIPPVVPGTRCVTVAGAIANDVHGKNHQAVGSFGEHVTQIRLRIGTGETVSLVPGQEVFRATIGGVGLTGAILSARIKLRRVASDRVRVHEQRMSDLAAFVEALAASEAHYSAGWIDTTAQGKRLGRGILEEAETTPVPSSRRVRRARIIPLDVSPLLVSKPFVRACNTAYYLRIPKAGRTRVEPLSAFLFPLDAVRDWNRLYGKAGFYQFQCVLPEDGENALRAMITEIAESRLASPLAVLKRMGPGRAGMLSFPMAGWTLAVDFGASPAAAELLVRLEAMTLDAGGRIYLAKDALLSPPAVRRMYPELDAFRAVCDRLDPTRRFASDLARRLRLREPPFV